MNKTVVITIDSDTFAEEISTFYFEKEREKVIGTTYKKAIQRIFEIIDRYNIKTTFFLISSHLKYEECLNQIKNIISEGHEISDHSYTHNRNLPLLSEKEIDIELENSIQIMKNKLGIIPCGFRTPGAELSDNLINMLSKKGYLYDSSLNPSLIYSIFKKIYFKFKKEKLKKTNIPSCCLNPHRLKFIYEFPLTISSLINLPLFNFFMFPLRNIGLKIIYDTCKKQKFINYVIHLHEFISYKEIPGIKIKKGLMNLFDTDIKQKILFLQKAIKIFKDNSKIERFQDFYNNLLCRRKNEKV